MQNSLLETQISAIAPYILQGLILVKWSLHQEGVVVSITFIIWCDNEYDK